MEDIAFTDDAGQPVVADKRFLALRPILMAGIVVGFLDGTAACVNAGIRGTPPVRVFQYIASSVMGKAAFDGGLGVAALGVLFHFMVATGAAAGFYVVSRYVPQLTRKPFIFGPLYGIAVYFIMREIVTPMTLVSRIPFSVSGMITGLIIHMVCVGLPIALITSKFSEAGKLA